jgi:hypothetical protein
MKLKRLTPKEYKSKVADICDSMTEDEVEKLTVFYWETQINGKKFFVTYICETDETDDSVMEIMKTKSKEK